MENHGRIQRALSHPVLNLTIAAIWIALFVLLDAKLGGRFDSTWWIAWLHQMGLLSTVIVATFSWIAIDALRHVVRLLVDRSATRRFAAAGARRRLDSPEVAKLTPGTRAQQRARLIIDTLHSQPESL